MQESLSIYSVVSYDLLGVEGPLSHSLKLLIDGVCRTVTSHYYAGAALEQRPGMRSVPEIMNFWGAIFVLKYVFVWKNQTRWIKNEEVAKPEESA